MITYSLLWTLIDINNIVENLHIINIMDLFSAPKDYSVLSQTPKFVFRSVASHAQNLKRPSLIYFVESANRREKPVQVTKAASLNSFASITSLPSETASNCRCSRCHRRLSAAALSWHSQSSLLSMEQPRRDTGVVIISRIYLYNAHSNISWRNCDA